MVIACGRNELKSKVKKLMVNYDRSKTLVVFLLLSFLIFPIFSCPAMFFSASEQRSNVRPTAPVQNTSSDDVPVVLTFDTEKPWQSDRLFSVLEALERHQVRATFFFMGDYAEERPEVLREVFRRGHEVGCHAYGNPDLSNMSYTEQLDNIGLATELITEAIGGRPVGFAAPKYSFNEDTLRVLDELGYKHDRSIKGDFAGEMEGYRWNYDDGVVVGADSEPEPLMIDYSIFELPITFVLEYGPSKMYVALSDFSWIYGYNWSQTQSLEALKAGLEQQLSADRPTVINLHPFLIGDAGWIGVLDDFLTYAEGRNTIFLTCQELVDWWFQGRCVRVRKDFSPDMVAVGDAVTATITISVLRGSLENVTVIEEVGDAEVIVEGAQLNGSRITWYIGEVDGSFELSYLLKPAWSTLLKSGLRFESSIFTLVNEVLVGPTLFTSSLDHAVKSNSPELSVFLPITYFIPALVASALLGCLLVYVMWRKSKIATLVLGTSLMVGVTVFFFPREILFFALIFAGVITAMIYLVVLVSRRKRGKVAG